jgi:2'-hydroxyisoflavone reductase
MKLLVLGGTRFLGRHFVEAAIARGHRLTLFNRGRAAPDLFGDVEQLRGDRDGELAPLRGRSWDAVVDTCGYLPRVVRRSVEILRGAVERYLFVSSISVYADSAAAGQDEDAARAQLPTPDCEDVPNHYGALKAACEDKVQAGFGAGSIIVRPGLIVGPFDPTGRFTYWPQRVARGGSVLAPAAPDYPVQFIDARDLAAWMLDLLERRRSVDSLGAARSGIRPWGGQTGKGVFNASGPAQPLSFGGFLDACRQALNPTADFVWPDAAFLAERGVQAWTELPLYAGDDGRGLCSVDLTRALAAGLRLRPVGETCVDTVRWAGASPLPAGIGLTPDREAELLRVWRGRIGAS